MNVGLYHCHHQYFFENIFLKFGRIGYRSYRLNQYCRGDSLNSRQESDTYITSSTIIRVSKGEGDAPEDGAVARSTFAGAYASGRCGMPGMKTEVSVLLGQYLWLTEHSVQCADFKPCV